MPIVRLYPESEVSPLPLPDAAPNVPAAGDMDLFGGNRARDHSVRSGNQYPHAAPASRLYC